MVTIVGLFFISERHKVLERVTIVLGLLGLIYSVFWFTQAEFQDHKQTLRHDLLFQENDHPDIYLDGDRIYCNGSRSSDKPSKVEMKTFPYVPYGVAIQNKYSDLTFKGTLDLDPASLLPGQEPKELIEGVITDDKGKEVGTFRLWRSVDSERHDKYTGETDIRGEHKKMEVYFMH